MAIDGQYKLEEVSRKYKSDAEGGDTMNNQVLLWSLFIIPWFTLVFMSREEIKRWIPVALLSIVTSMLTVEIGDTFQWWTVKENVYPLQTTIPYLLGLNPVITMWLLKYTYGHFGRYMAIDIVLNYAFIAIFLNYFLASRGIYQNINMSFLVNVVYASVHGAILYAYQKWQEGVFARTETKSTSHAANLQPAAAKPLPQKHEDNDDE